MKINENFEMENEGTGPAAFEDIVSDSHFIMGEKKRYRKKKHGIAGVFQRMGNSLSDWWYNLSRGAKRAIIALACVLVTVGLIFGTFRIVFDYNYNNITNNPEDLGFENVIDQKIVNIALFGIDSRDPKSFKGLSDSIMILSLNTETKTVKIISVMRDSLVPIEKNGKTTYGKINSAYSYGGPELAIKTLNTIFGLDISEYATVNFYGMSDIIDAVGGIDVTLAPGELNVMGYENGKSVNFGINGMIAEQCGYMGIDPAGYYVSEAGEKHLNGVQAVAYARIRHAANVDGTNNDYGRTDRQRYVMEQLFNRAVTLSTSSYVKLAKALIPCSETSLSYSEIMGLATNILLKSPAFEQTRIPLEAYQMSSVSVSGYGSCIYYDLDYAAKVLHAFLYENIPPEEYMAANGIEKNNWYSSRGSGGGTGTGSGSAGGSGSSGGSGGTASKNNSGGAVSSEPESSQSLTSSEPVVSSEPENNDTSSGESSSEPSPAESGDTGSGSSLEPEPPDDSSGQAGSSGSEQTENE